MAMNGVRLDTPVDESDFRLKYLENRWVSNRERYNEMPFDNALTLLRGTIRVGDAVQVEGSTPPRVGVITNLRVAVGRYGAGGRALPSATRRWHGNDYVVAINGLTHGDIPRGTVLIPAQPRG